MADAQDEPFTQLLKRVKSGDPGAKGQLFERLGKMDEEGAKILRMARRVLGPDDRARQLVDSVDLVQTALRVGWLDVSAFNGSTEKEFLGWIRGIIRNKLNRVVRKKGFWPDLEHVPEEEVPRGRESQALPVAQLMRDEIRSRLKNAIAELPEEQRKVLVLRLQGRRATEIAELLELKPEAVRKRESRAVARLRALLKERTSRS